jgi:hypothetical protein
MTPLERLQWAIAPDEQRSMSLLVGATTIFIALGGLAAFLPLPRVVNALFAIAMLAAWAVGLCGMIGYLRWYLGGSRGPK